MVNSDSAHVTMVITLMIMVNVHNVILHANSAQGVTKISANNVNYQGYLKTVKLYFKK